MNSNIFHPILHGIFINYVASIISICYSKIIRILFCLTKDKIKYKYFFRKGVRNLEIKYSKQALNFLKKQDTITQKQILNAISVLPKGDVKTLQGKDGYRLRIGDYRVIFNNIDNIIFIRMIGNRGQIYKGV